MKKLLLTLLISFAFFLPSQAQKAPAKTSTATTTKTKKVVEAAPAKTEVKKTDVVLKKDGTPDKRFSSSKKLKKDGTPDKRFKSNQ